MRSMRALAWPSPALNGSPKSGWVERERARSIDAVEPAPPKPPAKSQTLAARAVIVAAAPKATRMTWPRGGLAAAGSSARATRRALSSAESAVGAWADRAAWARVASG